MIDLQEESYSDSLSCLSIVYHRELLLVETQTTLELRSLRREMVILLALALLSTTSNNKAGFQGWIDDPGAILSTFSPFLQKFYKKKKQVAKRVLRLTWSKCIISVLYSLLSTPPSAKAAMS